MKDNPARFIFAEDASGRVTGLRIQSRIGPAQIFARTEKPLGGQDLPAKKIRTP